MCGRYFLSLGKSSLSDKIRSKAKQHSLFIKEGEIFPFDDVLVFIRTGETIDIDTMRWGLKTKRQINARRETIESSNVYKGMQRCAVLSSGFYEWHDHIKYSIKADDQIMYMAAIYNDDGLLIITEHSYRDMLKIHDRIPLILNNKEMLDYLFKGDLKHSLKNITIKEV